MIVKENIEIGGRVFVKTYSDGGFYIERKAALQLLYDSLNQGQQKKLLKNDAVKKLLVFYGVVKG